MTQRPRPASPVRIARRLAARLPGVSGVHQTLAAVRAERERLRAERDRLRTERDRLRGQRDAAADAHAARVEALAAPSFVALLEKSKRQRERARDVHGWVPAIWQHNAKDTGYDLARQLGIVHPAVYWRGTDLDGVDWAALPDRVVLKSVDGASARGVFPLIREGHQWRSVFDGWRLDPGGLSARIGELTASGRIHGELLLEEFLAHPGDPDALPFDWKVYCFGGEPHLVLQKDPRGTRRHTQAAFKFYDAAWDDLGPVRRPDQIDPDLPPPARPDALLETARCVATALGEAFVRVDLFEGPEGPLFGEVTPHPGGDQWYGPELDARLGAAWEAAEVDLQTPATRR